ncbi:unnamed protein product [Diamesa tonsa]
MMVQQQQQTAPKSKAQLNSGNYINVVPIVNGVQYHHRRKYPPQMTSDYQSRIYFGDYVRDRCREDYFPITTTTIPTSNQQHQHHHQQSVATSTTADLEQQLSNNNINNNSNSLIISPPSSLQLHPSSQTTLTSSSSTTITSNHPQQQHQQQQTITPSVLYTVQRVVSTSQLQQLSSNYGNNSNASSLTSIIARNETDCGLPNNNGPSTSTNNNYQQTNQLVNNQDAQQQQQQQQQQHLLHQQQQQSTNISNSNNNLIGNNYANYGTSTTSITISSAAATTSTTYGTSTINPPPIPRPMQKVIPTVVYLMSRIAVHMEIEGTAQCPAQVMLAAALGCEELGISNKLLAQSVFGLWMTSQQIEIQLKPHHRPYAVRVAWPKLLEKHCHGNEIEKCSDEPMTTLRRNIFYPRRDEEKIKDPRILELLYEEARHNVLLGRYIMESAHSIMLGGIQARIELGPYNVHSHTVSYFRENQTRFLPAHVAKSQNWSWLPYSRQTSAEVRLLEQFKRVPTTATTRKLMRKYLEFCWALPFYGAAFFHGQVEQPVRGLMSLVQQKDIPVLIAINEKGIYVIDHVECTLLLGLKYDDLSWDFGKPPSANDDPECLPCIFIQFGAVENGITVTKLMQIFSRQAAMMDALISHFADQLRRRKDGTDGVVQDNVVDDEPNPIQNNGIGVLSNKLSRLTLATFDDEGRCIGHMGSLSISY